MAVNLFFATALLSVTGSAGYILLKLLVAASGNRLSQSWRYHGIAAVSLLFVLPVHRLWAFIPVPYSAPSPAVLAGNNSELVFLTVSPTGVDMLSPQPLPTAGIDWGTVLEWAAALWLWVAVSLVLWNVWKLLRYRRLIEQASNKVNSHLQQLAVEEAHLSGIRGEVRLLASPLAQSPMLVGFFRPTILLPSEQVPDSDARFILAHELTHFRRKDLWKKLLLLMVRCVHWFNPIVYLLYWDFSRWLETSCDEYVVSSLDHDQRKEYGRLLINYAPASRYMGPKLYVSFTSCRYKLKRRIFTMLHSNKKSRSLLGLALAVVLTVGCLATSALAANADNGSAQESYMAFTLENSSASAMIKQRVEEPDANVIADEVMEYTKTVDISTFLTMEPADETSRAFEPISMDVSSGTGKIYLKALSMEAGQSINVNVAVSPASANVRVGIVDVNGNYRYLTAGSGSVNHNFAISARGTYYFCVENASSNDVSVAGFVNY